MKKLFYFSGLKFFAEMKRIKNCLVFCLALAPAFLLLYLILKYKVNVPLYDQWSFARFFEKINQGQLTFGDLFKQHNESRKFFTRLIFLPLAYLTHWNVRIELLVIFLFICLISFNVYRLSQITIGGGKFKTLSSFFLANLIIFSPLWFSGWTWGLQFIPIALILTAIVVAYSKLKQITKFFLSLLLCLVSTFSFVSGLVSWAVVFPVLFITSKNEKESPALKKWLQIGWIFSFLVVIILYFCHYKKPPLSPDLLIAFIRPLEAIQYFLAFFGAPLGYQDLTAATIIGIVALSLWILLLAYFLILKRNNSTLLFKIKGWGAVGAYAFICGILTTFGRLGFGVGLALSSRYTIFSGYLFISLFYLGVIFFEEVNLKSKSWLSQKLINGSLLFLLLIFSTLYLKTTIFSILKMKSSRQTALEGKACLLLIKIVPDEKCLKKFFFGSNFLIADANIVDKLNFLRPGLVKSRFIKDMAGKRHPDFNYGYFDSFKKIDNENIFIAGWAVLAERQEPADAVILTYKNAAGEEIIFGGVFDKVPRWDVEQVFRNSRYLNSGWQKQLGLAEIPKEAVKIKAWAMDAEAGRAYELKGEILCRLNFLQPGLIKIRFIKDMAGKRHPDFNYGYFDSFKKIDNENIFIAGWAVLAERQEPADDVILTYKNAAGEEIIFKVVFEKTFRPDVAQFLKNPNYLFSGWQKQLGLAEIPKEAVKIKAWAMDAEAGRAYELKGEILCRSFRK